MARWGLVEELEYKAIQEVVACSMADQSMYHQKQLLHQQPRPQIILASAPLAAAHIVALQQKEWPEYEDEAIASSIQAEMEHGGKGAMIKGAAALKQEEGLLSGTEAADSLEASHLHRC